MLQLSIKIKSDLYLHIESQTTKLQTALRTAANFHHMFRQQAIILIKMLTFIHGRGIDKDTIGLFIFTH